MSQARNKVVLSIFPGIDLLGEGMCQEWPELCIVRGPDPIFGGDIRGWHAPPGVFWGVLGGPPCQAFSRMVHIVRAKGQSPKANLIPEFERVVTEAQPQWFLMENVRAAPLPMVPGYIVRDYILNNRWLGGEQNRERRFSFGTPQGVALDLSGDIVALEHANWDRAVVASSSKEGALARSQEELRNGTSLRLRRQVSALPGQMPRRTITRCCELQGWPPELLDDTPFTVAGKYLVVGNGVPRLMARAIAKAIRKAMGDQ